MIALARGEEEFLRSVEISGNARLAQEIASLARHLRWDVEEELSRVFGDVVAHRIAGAARSFAEWQRDAARRVTGAAAEFLAEERTFPDYLRACAWEKANLDRLLRS